jgi:hypothetical protein
MGQPGCRSPQGPRGEPRPPSTPSTPSAIGQWPTGNGGVAASKWPSAVGEQVWEHHKTQAVDALQAGVARPREDLPSCGRETAASPGED